MHLPRPLRTLLHLAACTLLLASVHTAAGQPHKPRQMTATKQRFLLDKTIFVTSGFEQKQVAADFAKWLRGQGAAASNAYNKAQNRITFVKASSIEGASGNDAYYISVKSRRITVAFTSENALRHAVETLQGMLAKESGTKYMPGCTVTDWGARKTVRDHDATVDAAGGIQSIAELETTLKRQTGKNRPVYLTLVSAENWRMQSPSLEAADPGRRLYPSDGYYTAEQLQQIAGIGKRNHIEIIPTLELFAENKAFTSAFGHSVFSVEGMRLVRAAIEDCIETMHPEKICLGTMSDKADMRYMEFISDLAAMLGIELVIIEP